MASRRTRIKGIANIPQRRKTAVEPEKQDEEVVIKNEETNYTSNKNCESTSVLKNEDEKTAAGFSVIHNPTSNSQQERSNNATETINDKALDDEEIAAYVRKPEEIVALDDLKKKVCSLNTITTFGNNLRSFNEKKKTDEGNVILEQTLANSHTVGNTIHVKLEETKENGENLIQEKQNEQQENKAVCTNIKNSDDSKRHNRTFEHATSEEPQHTSQIKPLYKRHFIKPIISNSVLQRRSKIKIEDESRTSGSESESSSTVGKRDTVKSVHFLLDEKSTQAEQFPVKEIGDITYPPAPPSPSKINRGRIKVVPRLGQRRNSFSASESEDDNRKSNRHRNDSVCSTTSGVTDQSYPLECPHSPKKEFTNVVQRKFKRTEQSRKLAEARREFLQKFGTAKPERPDRQKLTMMDLIFYNPSGNPMSQKQKSKLAEDIVTENAEPDEPEEVVISDEENNVLPAPQIKVGPDGEITIDEQSLVIENKQLKRSQEKIQKSKLIDGDSITAYGVYTKAKRTKLWSRKETLRFYKALNAIGTDFSLMLTLFPGRTRRDLTMKFKKEEKINRMLIDKALMEPNTYDITELQKEMEMEEREERDKQKVQQEVKLLAKKEAEEKRKKKEEEKCAEKKQQMPPPRKRSHSIRTVYKDLNKGVNSFLDEESDADDESDSSSRTDDTVTLDMLEPSVKKKSLRPRKVRKVYANQDDSDEDEREKMKVVVKKPVEEKSSKVEEEVAKDPNMELGSVLLYSTTGPDGNPVYKFYMVAPVTGENVDVQNKTILNIGTVRVKENIEVPTEENNVTISATDEQDSGSPKCIIQQNIVIKPAAHPGDSQSISSNPTNEETATDIAQEIF